MGKGGKILIGCGIAVLVVGIGVAAVFVGGAFWLKGKAQNMAAAGQEMSRYEQQANQNPFTVPADGLLQEARLVKFLDVRKDVYAVYEAHKAEIESLSARTKDKKDLSVSETFEAARLMASLVTDIRLAQVKAMAAQGMSETEYRYIQQAVYKSAWAGTYEKSAGHQPAQDLDKTAAEMKKNLPGSEVMIDQMRAQARQLEVPEANVELFKKYEADITKYAMSGLAGIGL